MHRHGHAPQHVAAQQRQTRPRRQRRDGRRRAAKRPRQRDERARLDEELCDELQQVPRQVEATATHSVAAAAAAIVVAACSRLQRRRITGRGLARGSVSCAVTPVTERVLIAALVVVLLVIMIVVVALSVVRVAVVAIFIVVIVRTRRVFDAAALACEARRPWCWEPATK